MSSKFGLTDSELKAFSAAAVRRVRGGGGLQKILPAIGPQTSRAFVALAKSQAEDSLPLIAEFLAASERFKGGVDTHAVARWENAAKAMETRAKTLKAAERDELLREIASQRAVLTNQLATQGAKDAGAITRPRVGTAAQQAVLRGDSAVIKRAFIEGIWSVKERSPFSDAIERIAGVVGPAHADAWNPTFDYLASNASGIAKVEEWVEAAASAASQAAAARSRRAFHSKVKGLLGEAYASRCPEWLDLRDGFLELAIARAEILNKAARGGRRWEAFAVKGSLRIDNLEAWDEAVFVGETFVGSGPMPRAFLVVAAQYKVEKRVTALKQISRDVARETGNLVDPAYFSHELENGAVKKYVLAQSSRLTERPSRFLFNADGGKLSDSALRNFASGSIQAQQGVMRASVDQFNLVTDALMSSVKKVTNWE